MRTQKVVILMPFLIVLVAYFAIPLLIQDQGSASRRIDRVCYALQTAYDYEGQFPPATIYDDQGNALHSWRVMIVPHVEQNTFFELYSQQEPWNGPANALLHKSLPPTKSGAPATDDDTGVAESYRTVGAKHYTNLLRVVEESKPLEPMTGRKAEKLGWYVRPSDRQEIVIVELERTGIHWMEPRDLTISELEDILDSPSEAERIRSVCVLSRSTKTLLSKTDGEKRLHQFVKKSRVRQKRD